MSERKKSFVAGAALLAGAGLVGKVIGAFYRIWLSALIGVDTGMSIYSLPYKVYGFLLVISSAGLPTAISRVVSSRLTAGDRAGAREVMRSARRVLFITGSAASALMFALAGPLAELFADPAAAPAFMALAPSIFIVCLISAYRGYFQGMQRMAPTALSQLIEQVGKIAIGFPLAIYGMRYGFVWGAVGAMAGVSLSELAALLLMLGASAGQSARDRDLQRPETREKGILSSLFAIAIPVTIGSAMMPIVGLVDTSLVLRRLQDAGQTLEAARSMYGTLTGVVDSLVNMPAIITLSLSVALVPAISSALAKRDRGGARQTAKTGLKLAALIGLPAAVGMGMLAEPIVRFLYGSQPEEVKVLGGQLLAAMAAGIFLLSLIQTMTGVFQGIGRPILPVYTMGVGIVVKIVLNYVLIGMPGIGIMGAVWATLACYLAAAVGNLILLLRHLSIRGGFLLFLLRPAAASAAMGGVIYLLQRFLGESLGPARLLLVAVAGGVVVYFALALLLRALDEQDVKMMPGGRFLRRFVYKRKHG